MSLRYYLRKAYEKAQLSSEDILSTVECITGTLRPDRENLVLVYGGSFNPPHRGHVDILHSLLGPEVGALAVVVLPSENFHLRHKIAKHHPEFFLHQNRRADIWEAIPGIPRERAWVWRSTWYPFKPFTDALVQLTKADGFKLALSHVIGPDNLKMDDPLSMDIPCALPRMLVTNRARHVAAHFLPDGKPVLWGGFGEWTRSSGVNKNGAKDTAETQAVLWICEGLGNGNSEKRGYYLQCAEHVKNDINSTGIRRDLIYGNPLDERTLNKLPTEALLELLAPVL